jgi:DNA-binding PadR family transcriptional regulator
VPAPRSPLNLVVLASLVEAPMHVYRMQQLIEQRGKGRVVNVRSRASLYQAIERLERMGLVAAQATVKGATHPDRTVYAITDAGRAAVTEWLRELLRTTGAEFPAFIAAISLVMLLEPEDARAQLEERADAIERAMAATEAKLRELPGLPRLFLLEEEYRRTVQAAELAWLRGVVDDLRAGRLTWSEELMREMAAAFNPPEEA